ncbi:MAG: EF-P lysine aminoacylase EpmA [Ketobacter sp.]|tara:strand:- start:43939 stop:44943 length:1005 start_codon:yes stop_codon:yes gene_type:complete
MTGSRPFPAPSQSDPMTWQPSATLPTIAARAKLNRLLRDFFARRDVMEVETPLLCASTATDPHLSSWHSCANGKTYYLQTSPEFCMKRLLAAGCGPIYQLGKAFRHEEHSRQHNPEFTLLEWYRPDWSLTRLMDEVEALVLNAASAFGLTLEPFPRLTYQQAFEDTVGLNPHRCSAQDLLQVANAQISGDFSTLDRDGLLDLVASHLVEPKLPREGVILTEFPASKASLAKTGLSSKGDTVALRAELYIRGLEIANAYQELVDAAEQAQRFQQDLHYRENHQLACVPNPGQLIAALQNGFPECAGVALGLDRLLMVLLGCDNIEEVLSFTTTRA